MEPTLLHNMKHSTLKNIFKLGNKTFATCHQAKKNNLMQKTLFSLILCFFCAYSFSQSYVLHPNIAFNNLEGVDKNLQRLDVYTSDKAELKNLPVIVYVHGGAWRAGDKIQPQSSHYKYFTEQGYIFVSVNYRLSPKPGEPSWLKPERIKAPTHAYDVAKAAAWTMDNIEKYGGDPNSISIIGHSAGAHLALLVSTNEKFLNKYGKSTSQLKCTCSLDIAALNIPLLMKSLPHHTISTVENAFGRNEKLWEEASPMLQISQGEVLPEFLLVHRNQKLVEDQNSMMLNTLLKNGHVGKKVKLALNHNEFNTFLGVEKAKFDLETSKKTASPNAFAISKEYTQTITNFLKQCLARKSSVT